MRSFSINARAIGADVQRLLEEKQAQVAGSLRIAAQRGEAIVVAKSMAEASDQGEFARSWGVEYLEDGARLVNDAPHAAIVEEGSRPHFPPFYPILMWVTRQPEFSGVNASAVQPESEKYDLSDQQVFQDDPGLESARRVALAVARKIGAHGTQPRYVLRSSMKELARIAREEFKRAMES